MILPGRFHCFGAGGKRGLNDDETARLKQLGKPQCLANFRGQGVGPGSLGPACDGLGLFPDDELHSFHHGGVRAAGDKLSATSQAFSSAVRMEPKRSLPWLPLISMPRTGS